MISVMGSMMLQRSLSAEKIPIEWKELYLIGKENQGFQYSYGVLLGNRFWTFGRYKDRMGFNLPQHDWIPDRHTKWQSNQTTIWSTEKKLWIKGPDVSTLVSMYFLNPYYTAFASVINSTTILLIGGNTVACFNIVTNRWTEYPKFPYPLNLHIHNQEMIAITVNMDKNEKRYSFEETIVDFSFWKSQQLFFSFFQNIRSFFAEWFVKQKSITRSFLVYMLKIFFYRFQ